MQCNVLIRFKFGTVTSGQFRDHFMAFCLELATPQEVEVTAAADEATPGKDKKNSSKSKRGKSKKSAAPATSTTTTVVPAQLNEQIWAALQSLDWEQLFHGKGLPLFVPDFSNSLAVTAEELARKWIAAAAENTVCASASAKDLEVCNLATF